MFIQYKKVDLPIIATQIITKNIPIFDLLNSIKESQIFINYPKSRKFFIKVFIFDYDDFFAEIKNILCETKEHIKNPIFFVFKKGIISEGRRLAMFVSIEENKVSLLKKYLTFLNSIVSILLEPDGIFRFHGGYISNNLGKILITGKTGCGKSTLLYNIAKSGFNSINDRYCLVSQERSIVKVASVVKMTDTNQLKRINIRVFNRVKPLRFNLGKFSLVESLKPNIIIFPQISNRYKSELIEIPEQETFGRLISSSSASYNKSLQVKQVQVNLMKKLAKQCIGYIFASGKESVEDPNFRSYHILEKGFRLHKN